MDAGRPRVVAGYVLEAELGRGGMGVVWRARAPDGRPVALKLVLAGDPDALLRAAREQRLQGALGKAEGFVALLDAGVEAGRPWLALELLEGGTLRERLRRGPLPQAEAVELGHALARAMATAHARGIVHRDLKPENILFDLEGRPYVSDLGLAKHYRRDLPGASASRAMTGDGTGIGTPGYFPLEQAVDAARAGPAADVFALGAILHEALTGQRAFPASSLAHAVALLDQAVPSLASRGTTAPAWLEAVVAQALARDPSARFPDAGALAAALERGAATAGGRRRRRRAGRRGPALVAGACLAAAGLAAGLAAWRRPAPAAPHAGAGEPTPLVSSGPAAAPSPASAAAPAGPVELKVRRVIGERRRKHADDEVSAVFFSPDGRQVVSAGRDGVVRWWDAEGGDPDGPAVATGGEVWDLALLPDGRALAAGSAGLVVVDPATRSVTARIGLDPTQAPGVTTDAVELLPDGRAATAHSDGALRLWTLDGLLASRIPLRLGALWDLALDRPRGRLLLIGNDQGPGRANLTQGGAGWLDLATGEVSPVYAANMTFASRWWSGTPTEEGGAALCGEASDQSEGALLLLGATGGFALRDTPARLNRVAQRGQTLYGVEFSGAVTARTLGETVGPARELGRHARQAVVLAVDPRGRRLATGGLDGTVRLWDLVLGPDGAVEGATELSPPSGSAGAVRCLAPDGPGMATALGSDGVLRRLDLDTGLELQRRGEPLGAGGWSLGFSPSIGVTGLVASRPGPKVVLGLSDGRQRVTVDGLASLRVAAPRDDSVAMVTVEGQVVFFRDRKGRASRHLVPGTAQAIAWAGPDRVVVATREGSLHAVTPDSGMSLAGFTGALAALAAAPDGRWVAVGGESGELWWIVDGRATRRAPPALGGQAPRLLAPSPDGRRLAAAPRARLGALDRLTIDAPDGALAGSSTIVVLDAEGAPPGGAVGALTLPLTVDAPTALAWADARTLLVGTARGVVLVVDVPDGP